MKLKIAGSGSKGNAYILESEDENLIIEAGVKTKTVSSILNTEKPVVGLAIGHRHSDHAKYAKEYYKRFGAPIYANADVINTFGTEFFDETMTEGKTYQAGKFKIVSFDVYHDVPCVGFLVYHKEMGTLLYVSDSFALPNVFTGINHWLIEANYSDDILTQAFKDGTLDNTQYKRILTSHLSLGNCIKNLKDGHAEQSKTITLIHLSARHSDSKAFQQQIQAEFGTPTYIATKGLEITLDV